jgi:2'-5' RNA ligase
VRTLPRRRLGVALLVPLPVATEIDGLRRALGDGALGRIPAHLTLVPPVNVAADDIDDALAVLRRAARATRPLDLRIGPAATFHPVTPVVYLAVGGDLDALHGLRDRVFAAPLSRPLTHPFVPHVTVADDMDPARIPAALAALADYVADVRLDAVHLLEEGRGRIWGPIAEAPFARGRLPAEIQD